MKPAGWLSHEGGLLLHTQSSPNDIPLYRKLEARAHLGECWRRGPAHYECAVKKVELLQLIVDEDFCDANCSWAEHHADCAFRDEE
jgi:hypothetical protein